MINTSLSLTPLPLSVGQINQMSVGFLKIKITYSMGIDPDQTGIGVDRHGARDSAKGNRVVSSKGQGKRALLQVGGNRVSNRLGDGRDKASVEELANGGVGGRLHQAVVTVTVKLDLPVEFLELVKETELDDLEGALINTSSGLLIAFVNEHFVNTIPDMNNEKSDKRDKESK